MTSAHYYYEINHGVLCIWDLYSPGDKAKTVTNDAENVLREIAARGDMCSKVLYRDSTGTWDEMVVDSAMHFLDFRSLQERQLEIALRRVRESVPV